MDQPSQSKNLTVQFPLVRRSPDGRGAAYLRRGSALQKLNSVAGLVLFAFAATHLLNHALGLVGLETMYKVQQWRWTVTRSLPGSLVLVASLIIHVVYALARTIQ